MRIYITLILGFFFTFSLLAQQTGPVLAEKLLPPEIEEKQTLKKRAFFWMKGQWKIINNKYVWFSGQWVKKKVGFIYIDGEWLSKSNGWVWREGYWKSMNINKWNAIHS